MFTITSTKIHDTLYKQRVKHSKDLQNLSLKNQQRKIAHPGKNDGGVKVQITVTYTTLLQVTIATSILKLHFQVFVIVLGWDMGEKSALIIALATKNWIRKRFILLQVA